MVAIVAVLVYPEWETFLLNRDIRDQRSLRIWVVFGLMLESRFVIPPGKRLFSGNT